MKKSSNVLTFSWIGNIFNSVQSNTNPGAVVTSAAKVCNVVGIKPFPSLCTFYLLNNIQMVWNDVITINIILVIIVYNICSFPRSRAMKLLSLDQLCNLLKYAVSRMKTYSGVSVITSFLGMAADMPESCRRILVCTKH